MEWSDFGCRYNKSSEEQQEMVVFPLGLGWLEKKKGKKEKEMAKLRNRMNSAEDEIRDAQPAIVRYVDGR